MDSRAFYRHGPDDPQIGSAGHSTGGNPSAKPVNHQKQLPSLREVRVVHFVNITLLTMTKQAILPSLNTAIDSADTETSISNRLPKLQNSGQPFTGRPPGSNLSSPIYSQSSSMPDSYDELGQKNYESLHQFPAPRPSLNWSGPPNYPEMATTYAQRQPYYHQSMGTLKQETGLPPIRDMTFASPTMPSPSYNTVFGGSPHATMPMDYAQTFRRQSYNDGRSLSQTYPPYTRSYPIEKYGQSYGHSDYNRICQPYEYPSNYASSVGHGGYHSMDHDGRNKKRRGNLPKAVTDILKTWLSNHLEHPYPSEDEKHELVARTGLSLAQVGSQSSLSAGDILTKILDQQLVHQCASKALSSNEGQGDSARQAQAGI